METNWDCGYSTSGQPLQMTPRGQQRLIYGETSPSERAFSTASAVKEAPHIILKQPPNSKVQYVLPKT